MGRKVTFFLAFVDFFRADDTGAAGTDVAVLLLAGDDDSDEEPPADIIRA